jgi:hypothetical protein
MDMEALRVGLYMSMVMENAAFAPDRQPFPQLPRVLDDTMLAPFTHIVSPEDPLSVDVREFFDAVTDVLLARDRRCVLRGRSH